MNLPGVVVDLPTLTKKDEEDLVKWGVPNDIDLIAASFVRKKSDIEYIRKVGTLSSVMLHPSCEHSLDPHMPHPLSMLAGGNVAMYQTAFQVCILCLHLQQCEFDATQEAAALHAPTPRMCWLGVVCVSGCP